MGIINREKGSQARIWDHQMPRPWEHCKIQGIFNIVNVPAIHKTKRLVGLRMQNLELSELC